MAAAVEDVVGWAGGVDVAVNNAGVPMGRFAAPEERAPAVAFLTSDQARYINRHGTAG